jgi:hypothetical protein
VINNNRQQLLCLSEEVCGASQVANMASNESVFPNSEASVSRVVIPEPVLAAASPIPSTSTATAEEANSNQSTSTLNERAQKSTVNSHSSRMTASDFEIRYDDIWCNDRAERMVRVNLPPEGRPYARADFVPHLEKTVGLLAVEAIGPTQRSQVWEITFATKTVKQWFLDAGDFRIKNDFTASVHSSKIRRHYVKVLWYADCKRISDITDFIEKRGYKVTSARRGHSIIEGLKHARTNEVLLTVAGDCVAGLPYTYEYTVNGERRMSLISVPGMPPLCLKCILPVIFVQNMMRSSVEGADSGATVMTAVHFTTPQRQLVGRRTRQQTEVGQWWTSRTARTRPYSSER